MENALAEKHLPAHLIRAVQGLQTLAKNFTFLDTAKAQRETCAQAVLPFFWHDTKQTRKQSRWEIKCTRLEAKRGSDQKTIKFKGCLRDIHIGVT